jgi:hypothetical protein
MGITPITSLLPLPVARAIQADLDPLPTARVENSARTGDETYSPSDARSAGGSEENGTEDDSFADTAFEEESTGLAIDDELSSLGNEDEFPSPDDDDVAEAIAQSGESGQPRPISFFA